MMRSYGLVALVVGLSLIGLGRRADAAIISYTAALSGPNESPPNASPGTGLAHVDINTTTNIMHVQVQFSGLTAPTTASHIHAPTAGPGTGTAGVATTTPTFPDFPLGVTAGTYDRTFDLTALSSYNPAYVTANGGTAASAEAALLAAMAAGTSYLNIHTTAFPAGEIRGFLVPGAAVPEPAGLVLAGVGGLVLLAARKLRRLG